MAQQIKAFAAESDCFEFYPGNLHGGRRELTLWQPAQARKHTHTRARTFFTKLILRYHSEGLTQKAEEARRGEYYSLVFFLILITFIYFVWMSTKEEVRGKQKTACAHHTGVNCVAWTWVIKRGSKRLMTSKEHLGTRLPFLKTLTYKKILRWCGGCQ